MKRLLAVLMVLPMLAVAEEQVLDMNSLLKKMEQGRTLEAREHREREQRFLQDKNARVKMLADIKAEQQRQEQRSAGLEKQFEENDKLLAEAEQRLRERLGSLGELFGHITSAAGDARSNLETSLVSAEYPGRDAFLAELVAIASSGVDLPSIEQIEQLRYELLREMAEQGKVVRFAAEVSGAAGGSSQQQVLRVGVFNIINSDGQYLAYENGKLKVLARQPQGKYLDAAAGLVAASPGSYVAFGVDPTGPTGGSLLSALINSPTLKERWQQGGLVGYVITGIGVFALLLALWRIAYLAGVVGKVNRQLKSASADDHNPLGRVLKAAEQHGNADLETLELKINEAIIRELPRLQTGEAVLKIIAAVAPLLGLLGTVTGMIMTFQAITIYGAGDPTAMAGGISSALVTTVLGLVVAIPTVLMYTLVNSQSKRVIHILEEQAAGLVARHQEAG
ncbi:MAG TPA: MotA/TolQ/ExbB proton channel family protein [Pseudomonadales bacterium]